MATSRYLRQVTHEIDEIISSEWFLEKTPRTGCQALVDRVFGPERRHNHYKRVGVDGEDPLQGFHARLSGHDQIEEDDIRPFLSEALDSHDAVSLSSYDLELGVFQIGRDNRQYRGLIVDCHDAPFLHPPYINLRRSLLRSPTSSVQANSASPRVHSVQSPIQLQSSKARARGSR